MRSHTFAPVILMMIGASALADGAPTINLDRPGTLNQLMLDHPRRYQAVSALLRAAGKMPCKGHDIELLEARFHARDVECGMILSTSYPAKRHLSFALDGTDYAATVVVESAETPQPISTATEDPSVR